MNKRYDIAHTDENCVCTCKHNREIKKHKTSILKRPLTAPTTSLPSWDKKKLHNDHIHHKLHAKGKSPLKEFELYGDVPYPGDGNNKHAVDAHSLVQTDATSDSNQTPDAQKQESNKQQNPETPDPNESQHSDGAVSVTSVTDPKEAVHSTSVPDTIGTHDATTGSDPNEPQDTTTVPPITTG